MRRLPALLSLLALALPASVAAAPPSWVERSNENARIMIGVQSRFQPESSGVFGIEGLDEAVQSLPPERAALTYLPGSLQTTSRELSPPMSSGQ